ncbi:MAG: class I SAM-dependent methyltransferase [Burkholderiales bacterium]
MNVLAEQVTHALKLAAKRSALAPLLRALLRKPPPLARALKLGRVSGWDEAARWLLSPNGRPALEDPSLLEVLEHDINRDIDTELLLTAVRKQLLLGAPEPLREAYVQSLVCALIQQCINNEYVWFVSQEEQQRVTALIAPGGTPTTAAASAWQALAVLAMYRPLYELLGLGAPATQHTKTWEGLPGKLETLVRDYVAVYEEEMAIKQSIESFGAIKDPVSRQVAANYEAYPYPRWIKIKEPVPGSRQQFLRELFQHDELAFLERPFDVLVAGCGTGSKAIQIALGLGENARVWGADLSQASLAYAARMARKYQVHDRMKFLQVDILDLPKLGQQFDIVECTGVLHHMRDPLEGGKAVVGRVRPGGVVHISLYSELARREIVRLRREYEHRITAINNDEIRAYRYRLMQDSPTTIDDALPTRGDFFDLSRCKDLLFHPVEHRFTIPQLAQAMNALGLEFRGFEIPKPIGNQYWTPVPGTKHRRDLDRWWEFERRNPDAFQNLYEIWCRQPSARR